MRRFEEQLKRCVERKILSIFFMAGYPQLQDTFPLVKAIEEAGAHLIEIGIPYSDPLADGPVIQESSEKALANGMSVSVFFEQISELRPQISIPIYAMGYLNPVLQYGIERFLQDCKKVGVDGVILPDLPLEEYEEKYQALFKKYEIGITFLVTPQTSNARLKKIDELSTDFIYLVSTPSITGGRLCVGESVQEYYTKIVQSALSTPILVGFGLYDKESFDRSSQIFAGGIIGSAFIRAISATSEVCVAASKFISEIREVNQ